MPLLVLGFLYLFHSIALHAPILFNGVFPVFGRFLLGRQGILLLDILIVTLVVLLWGTVRSQTWAWWGSLLLFGLLMATSIITLVQSSYADILAAMDFPPQEMEFLGGVPAQGYHFAVVLGIPLLLTLGATVVAGRCFGAGNAISSH